MDIRLARVVVVSMTLLAAPNQPESRADTPKFPDLSHYTSVHPQDYLIAFDNPGRRPTRMTYFLSPHGVVCVIDGEGAACFGDNLPSVPAPDGRESRVTYIDTQKGLYQSSNPGYVDGTEIRGQRIRPLTPFNSINVEGVVCGVDDKGTTACKDTQGRGFILSPA
jgi:hypothetical protein